MCALQKARQIHSCGPRCGESLPRLLWSCSRSFIPFWAPRRPHQWVSLPLGFLLVGWWGEPAGGGVKGEGRVRHWHSRALPASPGPPHPSRQGLPLSGPALGPFVSGPTPPPLSPPRLGLVMVLRFVVQGTILWLLCVLPLLPKWSLHEFNCPVWCPAC